MLHVFPESQRHLCFGDDILLYSAHGRGFIASDGFASVRLHLEAESTFQRPEASSASSHGDDSVRDVGAPEASSYRGGGAGGVASRVAVDGSIRRASGFSELSISESEFDGRGAVEAWQKPFQVGDTRDVWDTVLRVVPARSYAAGESYLEAVENGEGNSADRLLAAARAEHQGNIRARHDAQGRKVKFGDDIQLLHVRSGKYLSALPRGVSRRAKDRLLVELQEFGSSNAVFKFHPRFKHRIDGDTIDILDSVTIYSPGTNCYCALTSRRLEVEAHTKHDTELEEDLADAELNLATDDKIPTAQWSMQLFRASSVPGDIMLGGDAVRIFHTEEEGYILREKPEAAPSSSQQSSPGHSKQGDQHRRSLSTPDILRRRSSLSRGAPGLPKRDTSVRAVSQTAFKSAGGDALGQSDPQHSAHGLWQFECVDPTRGDPIMYQVPFRLRHVATGSYLSVDASADVVTTEPFPRARELFTLHSAVGSASGAVPRDRVGLCMQHVQSGKWIRMRGPGVSDKKPRSRTVTGSGSELTVTTRKPSLPVIAESQRTPPRGVGSPLRRVQTMGGGGVRMGEMERADGKLPSVGSPPRTLPSLPVKPRTADAARELERQAIARAKKAEHDARLQAELEKARADARKERLERFWARRRQLAEASEGPTSAGSDITEASTLQRVQSAPAAKIDHGDIGEFESGAVAPEHSGSGAAVAAVAGETTSGASTGPRHEYSSGIGAASGRRELAPSQRPGYHRAGGSARGQRRPPSAARRRAALEPLGTQMAHTSGSPRSTPLDEKELVVGDEKQLENALQLVPASRQSVLETMVLVTLMLPLERYSKLVSHGVHLNPEDERLLSRAIRDLGRFCCRSGPTFKGASREFGPDDNAIVPIPSRQDLLREHGAIPLVVSCLRAPFDRWGGPYDLESIEEQRLVLTNAKENLRKMSTMRKVGASLVSRARAARRRVRERKEQARRTRPASAPHGNGSDTSVATGSGDGRNSPQEHDGAESPLEHSKGDADVGVTLMQLVGASSAQVLTVQRISWALQHLLRQLFKDNTANEVHVGDHLHVLHEQIGFDLGAEGTLKLLFRNNLRLLETLRATDVRAFLTLIRKKGRESQYLDFLTAICACGGRGVSSKQELMCDLIFGDGDGVFQRQELQRQTKAGQRKVASTLAFMQALSGRGNARRPIMGGAREGFASLNTPMVGLDCMLPVRPADNEDHPDAGLDVYVAGLESFESYCARARATGGTFSEDELKAAYGESLVVQMGDDEANWITLEDLLTHPPSAEYFVAMIKLHTAMCLDRNYTCIHVLERIYSRKSLFQCMRNTRLSFAIRSQLVELLLTVYIDVQPQEPMWLGRRTRLWDTLGTQPAIESRQFDTHDTRHQQDQLFFKALIAYITDYFNQMNGVMRVAERDHNEFSLSMLKLLLKLIEFGFFTTVNHLNTVSRPVVLLLDGRNDNLDPVDDGSAGKNQHENAQTEKASQRISVADLVMAKSTTKSDGVAAQLISGSARQLDAALRQVSAKATTSTPLTLVDIRPLIQGDEKDEEAGLDEEEEVEAASSLVVDADKGVLIKCKVLACRILRRIMDIRSDLQMQSVLKTFYENRFHFRRSASGDPSAESSREAAVRLATSAMRSTALQLDSYCETDIRAVLLDLLSLNDEELVTSVLELLARQFGDHAGMCSSLMRVQMIGSKPATRVVHTLSIAVPTLKDLAETSEEWISCETGADKQRMYLTYYLIDLMHAMMWRSWGARGGNGVAKRVSPTHRHSGKRGEDDDSAEGASRGSPSASSDDDSGDGDETDTEGAGAAGAPGYRASNAWRKQYGSPWFARADAMDTVDPERQVLLSNFGALQLIVNFLREADSELSTQQSAEGGDSAEDSHERSLLYFLISRCYRFLRSFVADNADNQAALWAHKDMVLHHVSSGLADASVVAMMLANNLALCRDVSTTLLRQFTVMAEGGADVLFSLLSPLKATLVCNGRVLGRNQVLVVRILLEHTQFLLDLKIDSADALTELVATSPDTLHVVRDHFLWNRDFGMSWYDSVMAGVKRPAITRTEAAISDFESGDTSAAAAGERRSLAQVESDVGLYLSWAHSQSSRRSTFVSPSRLLTILRVIDLLATCTAGHSVAVEASCQSLLPLSALVNALGTSRLPLEVRIVLHRFLNDAWLDVGRAPSDLLSNESLLHVLIEQCRRLAKLDALGHMRSEGPPSVRSAQTKWEWRFQRVLPLLYVFNTLIPSVGYLISCFERVGGGHNSEQESTPNPIENLGPEHVASALAESLSDWMKKPVPGIAKTPMLLLTPKELNVVESFCQRLLDLPGYASAHEAADEVLRFVNQHRRAAELSRYESDETDTTDHGDVEPMATGPSGAIVDPLGAEKDIRDAKERVECFNNFRTRILDDREVESSRLEEFNALVDALMRVEDVVQDDLRSLLSGYGNGGEAPTPDIGKSISRAIASVAPEPVTSTAAVSPSSLASTLSPRLARAGVHAVLNVGEWTVSLLTFDEAMRRLISYATNIQTRNEEGLVLVLKIIQALVERAKRHPVRNALQKTQTRLASLRACHLVFDQMTQERDEGTVGRELVRTAISLLDDGNKDVQHVFYQLFTTVGVHARTFVERLSRQIDNACDDFVQAKVGDDLAASEEVLNETYEAITDIFRMLQVLCEGHNLSLQTWMGTQAIGGRFQLSLVAQAVKVLAIVHDSITPEAVPLLTQVYDTLIECVQGPCGVNQLALVGSNFVETTGHLLSLTLSEHYQEPLGADLCRQLQHKASLALLSLFEGRTDWAVHDRVASQVPVRTLKRLMVAVYRDLQDFHEGRYIEGSFDMTFETEYDKFAVVGTTAPIFDEPEVPEDRVARIDTGFNIAIVLRALLDRHPAMAYQVSPQPGLDDQPSADADDVSPTEGRSSDGSGKGVDRKKSFRHRIAAGAKRLVSRKHGKGVTYAAAHSFFESHIANIEIVRNGSLEKFMFPITPMCYYLTSVTRERLKWALDRESAAKKIADFHERHTELIREMQHQQRLNRLFFKAPIVAKVATKVPQLKAASFILALFINFLVLGCYQAALPNDRLADVVCSDKFLDSPTIFNINQIITILGLMQTLTSSGIVFFYFLNNGPLIWRRGFEEWHARRGKKGGPTDAQSVAVVKGRDESTLKDIFDAKDDGGDSVADRMRSKLLNAYISVSVLLRSGEFMYNVLYLVCTLLGNFLHHFMFFFHLSDVVMRYEELKIVLNAVIKPIKALLLTAALFLVVQYVFALYGFTFLRSHYDEEPPSEYCLDPVNAFDPECRGQCATLFRCFFITFDQGFKNDGGIGGFMQGVQNLVGTPFATRLGFDILYNIILLTVLLNIVFGIIIDTFAEERVAKKEKEEDMSSVCFICNIDRAAFDRSTDVGFETHIKRDHYMLNYLYLLAYLYFKERTELTGVEEYLLEAADANDLSYYPVHRALALVSGRQANGALTAPGSSTGGGQKPSNTPDGGDDTDGKESGNKNEESSSMAGEDDDGPSDVHDATTLWRAASYRSFAAMSLAPHHAGPVGNLHDHELSPTHTMAGAAVPNGAGLSALSPHAASMPVPSAAHDSEIAQLRTRVDTLDDKLSRVISLLEGRSGP